MIFSTRSTYGLRAMINLAEHRSSGSVSLAQIAEEENISLKYLERQFASLKKAKLVKSVKGATGGYMLARAVNQITIYEIIKALEGKLKAFHCTDDRSKKIYCTDKCDCRVAQVLYKVERAVNRTLAEVKLSELLK